MSVILYEKKNGIGIITLNRPEKRNALNSAMINGLGQYLHEAADDSDVKVIVIRAEGEKAFTAGFDLKESMEHNITDIVERRADTKSEVDFFLYMWYLPKPIISAVQGYCIGGGITISSLLRTTQASAIPRLCSALHLKSPWSIGSFRSTRQRNGISWASISPLRRCARWAWSTRSCRMEILKSV